MTFFFELLSKEIGFSRSGRIILFKEFKKFVSTPNIVIPLKEFLSSRISFLEEFEKYKFFIISKEKFLKIAFIKDKFKDNGFIYTHYGTLERFQEILKDNIKIFSQENILALIPFNNPSCVVNEEFARFEINHHIEIVKNILKEHPDLNFGLTIKLFNYPSLIKEFLSLINEFQNIKLINFGDLFDSLLYFRNILKILIRVRGAIDPNLVMMVSGKIIPKFYPMLVYLGFDLIDSSYSLFLASEYFYDTIEYSIPIHKMKYLPCSCSSCRGKLQDLNDNSPSREKIELLSLHNLLTSNNYMKKITQYLKTEDFRFFVEKSSNDDTNMISILKILDKKYFDLICKETPINQERKKINSLGPSSYYRPDFVRFRKRAVQTFIPENWTTLIILLPCSAKKPYSQSRSHRKFHSVIKSNANLSQVQEFILTSPLGVIPRQLENIYPINSYDISVTGDWDATEIKITKNMLIKFLEKYDPKIPVICHLPEGGYRKIVDSLIDKINHKFYYTDVGNSPISNESLASLSNLIKEVYSKDLEAIPKIENNKRYLEKVIDFQYGKNVGAMLLSDQIKIKTDRRRQKSFIIDEETKLDLAKYNHTSGELELTFNGANKVKDYFREHQYIIFDGKQLKGSTLFRPGIIEYSLDLKPREYVMIWDNEKQSFIGIAKMIVGSNFLINSKSGRIADIIKKVGKT